MCSHPSFSEKHLFIISTSRSTLGPHFILLFNPEVSRVVKAIQIAFSPECICPLIESGRERAKSNPECNREWPLMEVSRGLIAVGGGNGTVVLMDLRLDDEEEVFGESTPSEVSFYIIPFTLQYLVLIVICEIVSTFVFLYCTFKNCRILLYSHIVVSRYIVNIKYINLITTLLQFGGNGYQVTMKSIEPQGYLSK